MIEKFTSQQKNLQDVETIKKLRPIINKAYENEKEYSIIVNFAKKLQNKHPDYQNYRLYHLFIGSTPPEDCPKFDFEGEDSIEKFLTSLDL